MLPTSLRRIVKLLKGRIRAESEDLAREMAFRVDSILEMPPAFGLMTSIRCGRSAGGLDHVRYRPGGARLVNQVGAPRGRECDLDREHGPLLQISRFYQVPEYCEIGAAPAMRPVAAGERAHSVGWRVV